MTEKEYYENDAFWGEDTYLKNEIELNRFQKIYALVPQSTESLLDVGCGNGAFLKYVEENNVKIKSTGYERSIVAIKNKLCKNEITHGHADQIRYKDNSFDLVVALEVIEHLPFQVFENTLKELQRIAKKNILISVPYNESERLIKCNYCGCLYSPFYHMRVFDNMKMKNLFNEFNLTNITYINSYRKYFLWDYLKAFWYVKLKNRLTEPPVHSACPQCGYHSIEKTIDEKKDNSINSKKLVLQVLKRFTPYKKSYTWIACLYCKK